MGLIENLKWRYATKQYDSSKKVSIDDIKKIKEAIQLSATSYGLQLFKILVIEDKDIRKKLKPASWNQPQITDASHLFVLCSYNDVKEEHIDIYLNLKADIQGLNIENLKGYGDFVKSKMASISLENKRTWTAKQTYIALSNLMNACAELQIDSTPIEGFDPKEYDQILGLSQKGLQASVVAAVGYRSADDTAQNNKKVRKSIEDLFETI